MEGFSAVGGRRQGGGEVFTRCTSFGQAMQRQFIRRINMNLAVGQ